MSDQRRCRFAIEFIFAFLFICISLTTIQAQQSPDVSTIIRGVDASVKDRLNRLAAYTVTEHYVVFRGHDETKPAAEMLVKTTYRKEAGKSYEILSQSGSSLWRNEVLKTLLENEQRMSQPGNVETALINSSNYDMKLDTECCADAEWAGMPGTRHHAAPEQPIPVQGEAVGGCARLFDRPAQRHGGQERLLPGQCRPSIEAVRGSRKPCPWPRMPRRFRAAPCSARPSSRSTTTAIRCSSSAAIEDGP